MRYYVKLPEVYQQIGYKDTFEIFIGNLKEYLNPEVNSTNERKKKPEELEQIVQSCLEILEQYMEH